MYIFKKSNGRLGCAVTVTFPFEDYNKLRT